MREVIIIHNCQRQPRVVEKGGGKGRATSKNRGTRLTGRLRKMLRGSNRLVKIRRGSLGTRDIWVGTKQENSKKGGAVSKEAKS